MTLDELPALSKVLPKEHVDGEALYITLTHSCSISSTDFDKEPLAEYILARKVSKPDNGLKGRKSPRKLHIPIQCDNKEEWFELSIHERGFFHRRILNLGGPSSHYRLLEESAETLIRWIVARYNAPAFPTEFNNRFALIKNEVAKKLSSPYITGFYVSLEQRDEELSSEEDYLAEFLISTEAGLNEDEFGICLKIEGEIESLLESCSGISLDGLKVSAVPENEITISDIRSRLLMQFDYLSERKQPGGLLPVNLIAS